MSSEDYLIASWSPWTWFLVWNMMLNAYIHTYVHTSIFITYVRTFNIKNLALCDTYRRSNYTCDIRIISTQTPIQRGRFSQVCNFVYLRILYIFRRHEEAPGRELLRNIWSKNWSYAKEAIVSCLAMVCAILLFSYVGVMWTISALILFTERFVDRSWLLKQSERLSNCVFKHEKPLQYRTEYTETLIINVQYNRRKARNLLL